MGEIMRTMIKSIYADFKGMQKAKTFNDESTLVRCELVEAYNKKIDDLSGISKTDYSEYKIPESSRHFEIYDQNGGKRITDDYHCEIPNSNLERILSRLEMEYEFEEKKRLEELHPVVIINKNEQNQVSYNINYNITDLIAEISDETGKKKLSELKDELEKPNKNWDTIKNILIWILNFSKDLFLQVLPIILEKYRS